MFLNNASSLTTRTPRLHSNNENANLHRSKSLASDSNSLMAMKTPKSKDLGTLQSRRRALGDISNRKNGLSSHKKANAGFPSLRQQQSIVKPKVNFATPSSKQGTNVTKSAAVLKPKTPVIHIDPIHESKTPMIELAHDYDAVLGVTSRWSTAHHEKDRSPFDFISREEVFMVDSFRGEIEARRKQEAMDEQKRMEVEYKEMLKNASECCNDGLADVVLHENYEEEDLSVTRADSWENEEENRFSSVSDLLSLLEDLDL